MPAPITTTFAFSGKSLTLTPKYQIETINLSIKVFQTSKKY